MVKDLKVGDKVRNKRSKLYRVIVKMTKDSVSYRKENGSAGKCSLLAFRKWVDGKDL